MKVDVIIPAHNPGAFLREALNSVVAQTYENYNIYVIDDASTEDVKAIVDKYKNATYLRTDKNLGPSGARNYGVRHGSGELISFLDADDIWSEGKLEYSVKEFKKDGSIGMTCGNYRRLIDRTILTRPFYRRPPFINWQSLLRTNYVACGSVTMRRDVFEEIGGFDENLWIGEDYKLWMECSQRYKIKYIDRVLYNYSVIKSGNSLSNRDDLQRSHRGTLDAVKKELLEKMNASSINSKSNHSNKNLSA